MERKKIIFLADMESFYASVEIARNPALRGKPVVVCGDQERRHGIVLAASKEAKACGIKTGMVAWECKSLCPRVIFVRPHMAEYITVSLKITQILAQYTDRVFPYSIDEQFLDMTGCDALFGTPLEMALRINEHIKAETDIRCRIGIGDNPLQAKMACDRFAKKNREGIFRLTHKNYSRYVWPLPARDLFGVGPAMEKNFRRLGITSIGDLACLPVEVLKRRFGINGEILWLNARGIDYSSVIPHSPEDGRKGIGHSITLPRDYWDKKEIEVVLLEMTEEVCRRARSLGRVGRVVHVYCRSADFDFPTGFSRQKKMAAPAATTAALYPYVIDIFNTYWDRRPVRTLGLSLSRLEADNKIQLALFEDVEKKKGLDRAVDAVKSRFGPASLYFLASLT
ncbi:MAG TPA: DNA polymerase IV, partial [Firmicutes bacterium]|nr:DNA polymerase IV [Bacillota bacterium]